MKRWAGLIIGIVAGVLLMGTGVYTMARLWSRPAGLATTPTANVIAAVTESAKPTHTPAPAEAAVPDTLSVSTEESSWLRELVPKATPTAAACAAPRSNEASWLPITRLSLQSPYAARGFDFQRTQLGDNRDRWVAASPDGLALVEIVGVEAVEEASVTVFGPIGGNNEDTAKRALYMLTMMSAILPDWPEGAEWFSGELGKAARQPGTYESEITHRGVCMAFWVDVQLGSITLRFEPE